MTNYLTEKRLPKLEEVAGVTKGELAHRIYGDDNEYDFVLPQEWVEYFGAYEHIGQIVWMYDNGSVFGMPQPLTQEAKEFMKKAGIS